MYNSTVPPQDVVPYSVLAAGYDVVMEHVDYAFWADYVITVFRHHQLHPKSVLELGCGTGSFALDLHQRGPFRYMGIDLSPQMIHVARAKAEMYQVPLQFGVANFANYRVDAPVDVALLLYDGLNYLLQEAQVLELFRCTFNALRPGGCFLFDQSTPTNSINNEMEFEDEGEVDAFRYRRHSRYDRETRLHSNIFDIVVQGKTYREVHVERAYAIQEIHTLLAQTPFRILAAYDGFSLNPATEATERVHWLIQRPA